MLKYFFILTLRNWLGEPRITFINILGLSFGFAASVLLYIFILHELSYEQMHTRANHIHRVITTISGDDSGQGPFTEVSVGPVLTAEMPEIDNYLRMVRHITTAGSEQGQISAQRAFMVDSTFFDFFDFKVLQGMPHQVLGKSGHAVLTQSLAHKLFGNDDPVGESFDITLTRVDMEVGHLSERRIRYHVGAVIENPPGNTHLQFDFLIPITDMDPMMFGFGGHFFSTYFLLNTALTPELNEKICSRVAEIASASFRNEAMAQRFGVSLQALNDIHFGEAMIEDFASQGNKQSLIVYVILAVFILGIVIANFINLSTARSEKRLIEVGVRKVLGSSRINLIGYTLAESLLIALLGMIIALLMIELFLPVFSNLLGQKMFLVSFVDISFVLFLLGLTLVTGLLAGLYPALYFSRFEPGVVLKGRFSYGKPFMRFALVTFQFTISVFLVISVWIVFSQLRFMQQATGSLDVENVLVYSKLTPGIKASYESVREDLLMLPGVTNVLATTGLPGTNAYYMPLRRRDQVAEEEVAAFALESWGSYKEFFKLKLVEGQWFEDRRQTAGFEFVINQTAARRLELQEPVIGQEIFVYQTAGKIIGVVEDYHFESRHHPIRPAVFIRFLRDFQYLAIKTHSDNPAVLQDQISALLAGTDINYMEQGVWLTDLLQKQYTEEKTTFRIVSLGAMLAILIAVIGLMGLTSYMIMARRKEICIRKVIGGGFLQILRTLMRDMMRWMLLANLIAWPLAWLAGDYWLNNFTYRISISPWYFVFAGALSLLMASLIIISQSYREVLKNPAEGLKAEQ